MHYDVDYRSHCCMDCLAEDTMPGPEWPDLVQLDYASAVMDGQILVTSHLGLVFPVRGLSFPHVHWDRYYLFLANYLDTIQRAR